MRNRVRSEILLFGKNVAMQYYSDRINSTHPEEGPSGLGVCSQERQVLNTLLSKLGRSKSYRFKDSSLRSARLECGSNTRRA